MNIVLVGIQWSGKGTQARKIVEEYGYHFFEMGLKLRAFSELVHPLAPKVKEAMAAGQLVSTDIIKAMLEHYKENHVGGNIIFDGIPRSADQKELFDSVFPDYIVIFLDLKKEEAIRRLAGRKIDPVTGESYPSDFDGDFSPKTGAKLVKRPDDNPEAVTKRVEIFYQNTLPLLALWAAEGKRVYRVDASKSPSEVFGHIEVILSAYATASL